MGNDIGLGSVSFDFCSTNVVQLSILSKVAYNDYKQQPVTEPKPMSLPLNHLP
jgi:hypothetical protein